MNFEDYKIEEMKVLYAEKLHFNNIQNATIGIGLTFIGTMIKIGIDWSNERIGVYFIFIFGIPIVCLLTLLIWIGAVFRVIQIAAYILNNENQIVNSESQILWERWLRKNNGLVFIDYFAIIALFLGIEIASIIYGIRIIEPSIYLIAYLVIIFGVSYFFIFMRGLKMVLYVKKNLFTKIQ